MLKRDVYISGSRPIPISVLIQTTNKFGCDIFIQCDQAQVNAKNYEDLKKDLQLRTPRLCFCFSGVDEELAVRRIERLFS